MIRRNNKIKAFTISEVLVSIMISTFAIYIFYSNVDLFFKMQADTIKEGMRNTQSFQFLNDLKTDISLSNEVLCRKEELLLIHHSDSISYLFNQQSVIKKIAAIEPALIKYPNDLAIAEVSLEIAKSGVVVNFLNDNKEVLMSINKL